MADEKVERPLPTGFELRHEGNVVLVVRSDWAGAVSGVFSPLFQAWSRILQRRFTARGRMGVVSFPLGPNLPNMMVRRYAHGGLFAGIGRDLYWGMDRALDELTAAQAAFDGGVRIPQPIGVLAQQVHGPLWRLAFLSAEISGSEDLVHYCVRLGEYPPETAAIEKRAVIGEAARQIRHMHDLGIYHADLHLKNILLRSRSIGPAELFLIDFDRSTVGPALDSAQRFRNLSRLARSVRKVRVADAVLTAWDRLRFLRVYLKDHPERRTLMRQWARRLASSGRGHEIWWTMTAAQRSLKGDRVGRLVRATGKRR